MKIEKPVTRQKVQSLVSHWAHDATTVVEISHDAFNADPVSGGYAFTCDRGLVIHGFDGSSMQSVVPTESASRRAQVEQWWTESQHRNRPLSLGDVNEHHRAVIAALVGGYDSVAELPQELRRNVTDTRVADGLFVFLRRHVQEPTEEAALRALARNDWLLQLPNDRTRAHPCPLCGRPAIGKAWQYLSVCDDCYPKTICSHDRIVDGYNISISGGFEAHHVDDRSVCDQATRDGLVSVDEHECHMGEAKFGGVYVGVDPSSR